MFRNQLINIVPFAKSDVRIVYQDLVYDSKLDIMPIVVPKGFKYDGASIPIGFRNLYPKFGKKYDYAACVHDYLCEEANKYLGTDNFGPMRKFADKVFLKDYVWSSKKLWKY
jgi:hypothetical protein